MLSLSALDVAIIKIDMLEKKSMRDEIRMSALRCRLTELLDNPTIVVVRDSDD